MWGERQGVQGNDLNRHWLKAAQGDTPVRVRDWLSSENYTCGGKKGGVRLHVKRALDKLSHCRLDKLNWLAALNKAREGGEEGEEAEEEERDELLFDTLQLVGFVHGAGWPSCLTRWFRLPGRDAVLFSPPAAAATTPLVSRPSARKQRRGRLTSQAVVKIISTSPSHPLFCTMMALVWGVSGSVTTPGNRQG